MKLRGVENRSTAVQIAANGVRAGCRERVSASGARLR